MAAAWHITLAAKSGGQQLKMMRARHLCLMLQRPLTAKGICFFWPDHQVRGSSEMQH
jgi:hypothetical protein